MQNVGIIESAYKKLLTKIRNNLEKTQQKITRQKVEMCHEIGRLVEPKSVIRNSSTLPKESQRYLNQELLDLGVVEVF